MLKSELDTPALILDLDLFEQNLAKMRDFAASCGKKLRPHAKTHKCPEIAKGSWKRETAPEFVQQSFLKRKPLPLRGSEIS